MFNLCVFVYLIKHFIYNINNKHYYKIEASIHAVSLLIYNRPINKSTPSNRDFLAKLTFAYPTNQLTPRSRVILKKPLVKKFPTFYRTPKFTIVLKEPAICPPLPLPPNR